MVEPGVPDWAVFGDRSHRRNLICSINLSELDLEQHNMHLNEKYERMHAAEQRADLYRCDDADMLLVACNTPSAWRRGPSRTCARGPARPASSARSPCGRSRSSLCAAPPPDRAPIVVVEASNGQLEDEMRLALSHADVDGRRRSSQCAGSVGSSRRKRDRRRTSMRPAGEGCRMSVFYRRFERHDHAEGLKAHSTHYCPGCGHGLAHKYLAEAIDELGMQDRTILVSPVGCSVFMYYYFDVGNTQAAHGRAPAVAMGHKPANPDSIVICYQGDGDLASIGLAEIVSTAQLGIPITVIFVNNAIYGMTGGQMAPTTLIGQRTTTTPEGRTRLAGQPLRWPS